EENEPNSSQQGGPGMTSIADGSVKIQTASASNFSTPAWFGEIVVISSYLQKHKMSSPDAKAALEKGEGRRRAGTQIQTHEAPPASSLLKMGSREGSSHGMRNEVYGPLAEKEKRDL
ncbi:MAG TPA: hypothetical protein VIZ18_06800, partial [Ktedonobacteraceae bacterium]